MLPHRIQTTGDVTIPPQTGDQDFSALERGFRGGAARDPGGPRSAPNTMPQTRLLVPTKPAPAVELPGTSMAPRHPAPGAAGSLVRVWGTGEWDQVNTGGHGELSSPASTVVGEQARVSNVHGNTWRLAPQPWDGAQVIGYQGQGE